MSSLFYRRDGVTYELPLLDISTASHRMEIRVDGVTKYLELANYGTSGKYLRGRIADAIYDIVSGNGVNWRAGTTILSRYNIAYGNGKFVAVGEGSNLAYISTDGINWTTSTLPSGSTSMAYYGIAYGNGLFVVGGYINNGTSTRVVITSPDGITWTQRTTPVAGSSSGEWYRFLYGNGIFVAVANVVSTASIMTSSDGITWTARTHASASPLSVCYGNGRWIATISGSTSTALTSTDNGVTWSTISLPSSCRWGSVAYGNGIFVAVGAANASPYTPYAAYSTNGTTWYSTSIHNGGPIEWTNIIYVNGYFIVAGWDDVNKNAGYIYTSPDGITWTLTATTAARKWFWMAYGGGRIVLVTASTISSYLGTYVSP